MSNELQHIRAEIDYRNSCQSPFSGMYLVFEVFQEGEFKEMLAILISLCKHVSRFWGVSDKVAHFCFPCSLNNGVANYLLYRPI